MLNVLLSDTQSVSLTSPVSSFSCLAGVLVPPKGGEKEKGNQKHSKPPKQFSLPVVVAFLAVAPERRKWLSSAILLMVKMRNQVKQRACFFLRASCASSAFPVFPRLFEEDLAAVEV